MVFDADKYMHSYCQYFAIAFAEMFDGKVCLWLDKDYDAPDEQHSIRLCHAYAEFCDGVYVDSYGVFKHISVREDEFEFNEQHIVKLSVEDAKKQLRKLGIPYGDTETKREVREFLRNNMFCLDVRLIGGKTRPVGLYSASKSNNIVGVQYYCVENSTFAKHVTRFAYNAFASIIVGQHGFLSNPRWYVRVT